MFFSQLGAGAEAEAGSRGACWLHLTLLSRLSCRKPSAKPVSNGEGTRSSRHDYAWRDRPKGAHEEFDDVSVMPRAQWEPWVLYREPIEARTVTDDLRKWKTGGLRRISEDQPFGDVIRSHPTGRPTQHRSAPEPKTAGFLRRVVRAMLPLARRCRTRSPGAGSTLAAAEAVGYDSIGIEVDPLYFNLATQAIPLLAALPIREDLVVPD